MKKGTQHFLYVVERVREKVLSVWHVRLYKYINLFKLSSDMSKLISESFKMHANVAHRRKKLKLGERRRCVVSSWTRRKEKGASAGLKHVASRTRSTFA